VYQEAEEEADDTGDEGGTLKQAVAAGDVLAVVQLEARQTFAKPPRRFDEATLVAELEKRQIGRPSTYAAILGTIQGRNYIATGNAEGKKVNGVILTLQGGTISRKAKTETIGGDKAKLLPTPKGTKLTEFLETNFAKVVDYKFTAGCEEVFDQIADGASTYADFVPVFDQKLAGWLQRVEEAYQDVAPADQRLLGELEGKPVTVGKGKFGTYVLHDEVHYSVDGLTPEAVTLAKALAVIAEKKAGALREVGTFQGKPVAVGKGKFGTYVAWEKQYFNAPAGREPADITATEAAQLITEGLAKKTGLSDELVATIGKYTIRQGEKGLYVTDGKDRAGLFKDVTREQAQAWTEDQCKDTINKFLAWKKKQK
jgi:DNA topoisomerase-1